MAAGSLDPVFDVTIPMSVSATTVGWREKAHAVPEKVQSPADRITDHVWHKTSVESRVGSFILDDIAHYAHRVTDVTSGALVDC